MWLITVLSWFNRRGQFIFHIGPGRFVQLFFLNKWNHHLKNAFCIYLYYLCVILKIVWWSEAFKCDKYAKNKKNMKGQKTFSQHCTGASQKIRISWKSSFFVTFQKVKLSYILDSLHVKKNISKVFLFSFWWLELTAHECQKSSISKY